MEIELKFSYRHPLVIAQSKLSLLSESCFHFFFFFNIYLDLHLNNLHLQVCSKRQSYRVEQPCPAGQ